MQSVAAAESASSAVLKRDNGSKTQHWHCNRISHRCENMPSSRFAPAICSCVCLKPDECAVETTAEAKQSHSSCQQPKSPQIHTWTRSQLKNFETVFNVTRSGLLFSASIIKAGENVYFIGTARPWHLSERAFHTGKLRPFHLSDS